MQMYTTIQKWGNSRAVRLPKAIFEKLEIAESDQVEIKAENGMILLIPVKKHKTLQERIAEYQGDYQCGEWDTGKPVGKEV